MTYWSSTLIDCLIFTQANTKLSTTSAAARAIDCITFRQFAEQKSHEGLPEYTCLDAPYFKNDGPALPNYFEDKLPSTPVLESINATKTEEQHSRPSTLEEGDNTTLGGEKDDTIFSKSNPRQELHHYYGGLISQEQLGQLKKLLRSLGPSLEQVNEIHRYFCLPGHIRVVSMRSCTRKK